MEIQQITVDDPNKKFDQVLIDNNFNGVIPANTIVNKRRPSFGATYSELQAERQSIIIEPFITVIEVKKVSEFSERIFVVMKGVSSNDMLDFLKTSDVKFKKIITTPESFVKVIRALKTFDTNYRDNYFLLIDECEKLIQSASFRKRIFEPIDEFFTFKNKAMVSSTPKIPSHPEFIKQNFKILDFKPSFIYQKDIKIRITNNIRTSLRHEVSLIRLKDKINPIFLFTNCRRSILYFTRLEETQDDFKVFCAEDLDQKFFKINYTPNVEYSVQEQQYALNNAFTSRFFPGVDMWLNGKPHVILLTNLPYVPHSIIDPETDAIQAQGRARNGISSITHITNLYYGQTHLSDYEQELDTEKELYFVNRLNELKNKAHLKQAVEVILSVIDKQHISKAFNEDGTVSSFSKDHYTLTKALKNIYCSKETLLASYIKSGFFIPKLTVVQHIFSDADELSIEKLDGTKRSQEIVGQLERLFTGFDEVYNEIGEKEYFIQLTRLKEQDELLYKAYVCLGYDFIVKVKYDKKKIKEAMFEVEKLNKDNYFLMVDKIILTFKLHSKHYSRNIKLKLQEIYDEFNYQKGAGVIHIAKASDITNYFECKLINGKVKDNDEGKYGSYYRLHAPKDKLSEKLNYMVAVNK